MSSYAEFHVVAFGLGRLRASLAQPPAHAPAHGWRKKHDPYYAGYNGGQWERDFDIASGSCNRQEIATVIGAVAGGAIANRVADEHRTVATIVGAIAGASSATASAASSTKPTAAASATRSRSAHPASASPGRTTPPVCATSCRRAPIGRAAAPPAARTRSSPASAAANACRTRASPAAPLFGVWQIWRLASILLPHPRHPLLSPSPPVRVATARARPRARRGAPRATTRPPPGYTRYVPDGVRSRSRR